MNYLTIKQFLKLANKNLNESEFDDMFDLTSDNPLDGVRFVMRDRISERVYVIKDFGGDDLYVFFDDVYKKQNPSNPEGGFFLVNRSRALQHLDSGLWQIVNNDLNESGDLSWIKNSKATLKDKVIVFEPMLNFEEWNRVLDLLMSHVVAFDEDIVWWSGGLLDGWNPLEEGQYLHHLLIANSGQMVYGAMDPDMADTLRDDGFSEDEIANDYEHYYGDIDLFIDDKPSKFDSPETIDGRKYFNIPYKKPIQESEEIGWIKEIEPKWDSSNIHLVAGKKFYVSRSDPQYQAYWFEDNIRPKPKKKTKIPIPKIKVCWEERHTKKIKCSGQSRWRVIEKLNDGTWILMNEETIKESEEMVWITDTELPILPYIGKRFKLILDGGKDSGRRYKIIDYYYEGKYNKDYYVNSVLLDPETLKETQKRFNSPMDRAMELIKDGNWVFIDKI